MFLLSNSSVLSWFWKYPFVPLGKMEWHFCFHRACFWTVLHYLFGACCKLHMVWGFSMSYWFDKSSYSVRKPTYATQHNPDLFTIQLHLSISVSLRLFAAHGGPAWSLLHHLAFDTVLIWFNMFHIIVTHILKVYFRYYLLDLWPYGTVTNDKIR